MHTALKLPPLLSSSSEGVNTIMIALACFPAGMLTTLPEDAASAEEQNLLLALLKREIQLLQLVTVPEYESEVHEILSNLILSALAYVSALPDSEVPPNS